MTDPAAGPALSEREPRVKLKHYGRSRANLLRWGVPLALVVLIVVSSIGSGVATPVGSVQVTCEGYTRIDHRECAPWGQAILDSEVPEGHTRREVSALTIKRSMFGLIDHCTAEFALQGGASVEHETACR
jgi:hypothetical protein